MNPYVALLRGIMPGNPNMRNARLREAFEAIGLGNVRTVISSGNVLFESPSEDVPGLERRIEAELRSRLGISGAAIVRSLPELRRIVAKDPFKGKSHGRESYLIVTFRRKKPREIYAALDLKDPKAADFMRRLEKEHGTEVTTRTWKTVERIVAKLEEERV